MAKNYAACPQCLSLGNLSHDGPYNDYRWAILESNPVVAVAFLPLVICAGLLRWHPEIMWPLLFVVTGIWLLANPLFIWRNVIGRTVYAFQDKELNLHVDKHRPNPYRQFSESGENGETIVRSVPWILDPVFQLRVGGWFRKNRLWKLVDNTKLVPVFKPGMASGYGWYIKSGWRGLEDFVVSDFVGNALVYPNYDSDGSGSIDSTSNSRTEDLLEIVRNYPYGVRPIVKWAEKGRIFTPKCQDLGQGIGVVIAHLRQTKNAQRSKSAQEARQLLESLLKTACPDQAEEWLKQGPETLGHIATVQLSHDGIGETRERVAAGEETI